MEVELIWFYSFAIHQIRVFYSSKAADMTSKSSGRMEICKHTMRAYVRLASTYAQLTACVWKYG